MDGAGTRAALVTTGAVLFVLVAYSSYRQDARRSAPSPASVDVAAAPPSEPPASAFPPSAEPLPTGALPAAPTYETAGEAGASDRPASYVVARGDSLWTIARRFYGDGRFARAIYEANRDQMRRPQLLHPGQRLVLP